MQAQSRFGMVGGFRFLRNVRRKTTAGLAIGGAPVRLEVSGEIRR
jgi:hypothetical protein